MIKILKFSTPTCPVCVQLDKVLTALAQDLKFIKEEHNALESKLAEQYQITSVPTLIILKDDAEIARRTGMCDKSTLRKIIEAN